MARPLNAQVVVLTGASSGIVRATAVELGRRGARVVLAARTDEALDDVAREVSAAGGQAAAVPTDVADWPQVENLARRAVERFGRIDTWVNNAGVTQYATVEDSTVAEMEQILRVNLLGAIHGSKAALTVLKRQHEGTLINVASVLGRFSVPLAAAYCASKHGVVGFTDSLRLELAREGSPVQVCTVMPGSTNTPLFTHARAKLGGHKPQPLPPAYEPEVVAEAIVHCCEHPQRELLIGLAGQLFELTYRLSPALLDKILLFNDIGAKQRISDKPDEGRDNLFGPRPGAKPAHGDFPGFKTSEYTRLIEERPLLTGALLAGGLLGVLGAVALVRRGLGAGDGGARSHLEPVAASEPDFTVA
jgi:NAD(P)-dependent dehydrogenase (short-subunit alcohol dehydrogenase family)